MILREYQPSDCERLAELFYDTVHSVNARDYTEEQLNAWAAGKTDLAEWNRSLSEHYSVVAQEDGRIVGFGDIDETGYLDRLYVHKDYQNQGIATALCRELEAAAGSAEICTHASVTARPFFEGRGYRVIEEQQVVRNGIPLTNYIMKKQKYKEQKI